MERPRRLSGPRWRGRTTFVKITALLVFLCFFFLLPSSKSSYDDELDLSTARATLPPTNGVANNLHNPALSKEKAESQPSTHQEIAAAKDSGKREQSVLQPVQEPHADVRPLSSSAGGSATDLEQLREALVNLMTLLPDEGKVEELLLPFYFTGAQKLREVGVKARMFKAYFKAWEALHLVSDAGDVHVRNDVVRLIRDSHKELHLPESNLAQTLRSYEDFRFLITGLGDLLFPWTAPYFGDHMSLHASFWKAGRGIALSAGQDQIPYLLATIPAMRHLGCNLPIEVMYLGDEDISEEYRDILEQLPGVVTRNIKQMVRDEGWELAGWAAKPFAILFSSFREVMFIDADAVFLTNPALLFDDPQYKQTGALFFKDRSIFPESKRRWLKQILPKPISKSAQQSRLWTGESGHQQESGVVLVDKWRHFVEMLLVTRMNGPDRDGDKDKDIEGVYDMVYGDKETFWLAWELLSNSDYAFHEGHRGSMGVVHQGPILPTSDRKKEAEDEKMTSSLEDKAQSDSATQDSIYPSKEATPSSSDITQAPIKKGESGSDASRKAGESRTQDGYNNDEGTKEPLRKRSSPPPPSLPHSQPNFTICGPQLLHLDSAGTPLWFNGWLASNKYRSTPSESVPAVLDVYLIEPAQASKKNDVWQLGKDNEACLTADRLVEFSTREREVLGMVRGFAIEVGALGRGEAEAEGRGGAEDRV